MCPEAEQAFRDRMRDIDSFERESEGGPPSLAVKKFARNVRISPSLSHTLWRPYKPHHTVMVHQQ